MRTVFTHSLVCIRNLTRSLRSLVRFPILDQLVRKYRTHTLSMKYSIYLLDVYPYVGLFRMVLIVRNVLLELSSPRGSWLVSL